MADFIKRQIRLARGLFNPGNSTRARYATRLLVQLPPSLAFDSRVIKPFFAVPRRRFYGGVGCEPSHAGWFGAESDRLWTRHKVARVAAAPSSCGGTDRLGGDGSWRYWRWHGSPWMYYSAYDTAALAELADDVVTNTAGLGRARVIFDNTAHGHDVSDATGLQSLLKLPVTTAKKRLTSSS